MIIEGMTAIVSGGGSGLGAATGRWLARRGANVVLVDINQDAANTVAEEIGGIAIACDVTDADSATEALSRAADRYGAARILVNCAGIASGERIVGRNGPMPLDNFRQVIEINLIGSFNLMRLAAAQMMAADPVDESGERGVIVNTASVAAYEGQIGQAAYSASKGGIVSLTLQAAREFASQGIRVMTIAPGLIATPLLTGLPEAVRSSLAEQVPFPARFGEPDEFARLVEHIVENQMLNGDVIRLDGAIRMQAR